MAQEILNLGAAPNDGTGDTLRAGGQKINNNFTELYASVAAIAPAGGFRSPVRCRTTANVNLAAGGIASGTVHDGVTVATGDRIFVAAQTSAAENGIYVVPASGAATRATDADSPSEIVSMTFQISEGTTHADQQWTCTTDAPIVVGTTALNFARATGSTGLIAANNLSDVPDKAAARANLGIEKQNLALPLTFNFSAAGDASFYADEAMTLTQQATVGTGTVSYEKSTAATPSTFSSTSSPISLEAGAWLRVTVASVTTRFAVHLKRTA